MGSSIGWQVLASLGPETEGIGYSVGFYKGGRANLGQACAQLL